MPTDVYTPPPDFPVPVDDGAADYLRGVVVPSLALASTSGASVDLARLDAGQIRRVWDRVCPPDRNAETVLAWLRARA